MRRLEDFHLLDDCNRMITDNNGRDTTNLSTDGLVDVRCVHHVDLNLGGARHLTRLAVRITNLTGPRGD